MTLRWPWSGFVTLKTPPDMLNNGLKMHFLASKRCTRSDRLPAPLPYFHSPKKRSASARTRTAAAYCVPEENKDESEEYFATRARGRQMGFDGREGREGEREREREGWRSNRRSRRNSFTRINLSLSLVGGPRMSNDGHYASRRGPHRAVRAPHPLT